MGLNLLEFVWDFLKQALIFVVAAVVLFLVVSTANADDFFMRYYVKDLGLETEALHSARGDVEIQYTKIVPGKEYDYSFGQKALLLRKHTEKGEEKWAFRKRYGIDGAADGVKVQESLLEAPEAITFRKAENKVTVNTAMPASICPLLAERPVKVLTLVMATGSSPAASAVKQAVALKPEGSPTTVISIAINTSPDAAKPVITASDDNLGRAIGCRIKERMKEFSPELKTTPSTAETPPRTVITITYNPNTPSLSDERVASSVLLSLDEVLR